MRKFCITGGIPTENEDGRPIHLDRLIFLLQPRSSTLISLPNVLRRYQHSKHVCSFAILLTSVLINSSAVMAVVISGILGFYLSNLYRPSPPRDKNPDKFPLEISFLGQIFGWGCAVLYLGSRIPQVIKNFRRQSTDGLSILFFLFACLGNITYVLSIISLSLEPRYLFVNLSWLAGSAGTLMLDALVPWFYECQLK